MNVDLVFCPRPLCPLKTLLTSWGPNSAPKQRQQAASNNKNTNLYSWRQNIKDKIYHKKTRRNYTTECSSGFRVKTEENPTGFQEESSLLLGIQEANIVAFVEQMKTTSTLMSPWANKCAHLWMNIDKNREKRNLWHLVDIFGRTSLSQWQKNTSLTLNLTMMTIAIIWQDQLFLLYANWRADRTLATGSFSESVADGKRRTTYVNNEHGRGKDSKVLRLQERHCCWSEFKTDGTEHTHKYKTHKINSTSYICASL